MKHEEHAAQHNKNLSKGRSLQRCKVADKKTTQKPIELCIERARARAGAVAGAG